MIKLESKYDEKDNSCKIKCTCKNTNTYEHLYGIAYLIENTIKNDPFTDYDEIIKIMNDLFKEEKKNGKRNSKSKTEV